MSTKLRERYCHNLVSVYETFATLEIFGNCEICHLQLNQFFTSVVRRQNNFPIPIRSLLFKESLFRTIQM